MICICIMSCIRIVIGIVIMMCMSIVVDGCHMMRCIVSMMCMLIMIDGWDHAGHCHHDVYWHHSWYCNHDVHWQQCLHLHHWLHAMVMWICIVLCIGNMVGMQS